MAMKVSSGFPKAPVTKPKLNYTGNLFLVEKASVNPSPYIWDESYQRSRHTKGHVIPKTFKMVLDTSLHNTQQYKVHIKGKVEQSSERSCTLGVVAIEKGALWSSSTMVANF